jgi:aldehyde dehydrogenase (NAD+)
MTARRAEEIFGPILPIVTLPSKDAIVEFINARETPLAIYMFTQSSSDAAFGASFFLSPS